MKKLKCVPFVVLIAFTVVACGKSDSSTPSVAGGPVVVQPQPLPQPQPNPQPNPNPSGGSQVQEWCYQSGGQYFAAADLCGVRESVISGNWTWNWMIGKVDTGIQIFPNDIVSVLADGNPSIQIGSRTYSSAMSFTSQTRGSLSFKRNDFRAYQIRKVQIARCFGPQGYGYACPVVN